MDICARRTFQTVTKRPMLDAGHPASCRHSRAPYRHQPRAPRFGNQTPPRETNTEIEYPIPGKNYSISTSMGKWKKKNTTSITRGRATCPAAVASLLLPASLRDTPARSIYAHCSRVPFSNLASSCLPPTLCSLLPTPPPPPPPLPFGGFRFLPARARRRSSLPDSLRPTTLQLSTVPP